MGQFFRTLLGQSASPGHITVTVDHTKAGASDATDFPMLLTITDARLKTTGNGGAVTNANGYDIRISTDTAGASLLPWRTVKYDGAAGTFTAIVKLPTLSHTVDTVLYVPFGDATITTFQGGAVTAVWNAGFVSRFGWGDGVTLDITDDTASANNGTNHGSATAASGPSGLGAVNFAAGTNAYISTTNTQNIAHPTVECWFYVSAYPSSAGSLAGVVQGVTTDKNLAMLTDGTIRWYVYDGGQKVATSPSSVSTGAWHYAVGVADGSNATLYVDGVAVASTPAGNTFTGYSAPGFEVNGEYPTAIVGSTFMASVAAEARLSNVARSADWILATYNNISSPATFYRLT